MNASPSGLQTIPAGLPVMPGPMLGGQPLRIGETVSPGFDPRASGLQRPVGSLVYSRAGDVYYVKTGPLATDWSNLATVVAATTATVVTASGSALADADYLLQPFTDKASQYKVPALTLSANRNITLGVTGPPITGTLVRIVRLDVSAFTIAFLNGGTNGGTLVAAVAPGQACSFTFYYNGADWVFVGFEYATTGLPG